jgi:hypothetical protein
MGPIFFRRDPDLGGKPYTESAGWGIALGPQNPASGGPRGVETLIIRVGRRLSNGIKDLGAMQPPPGRMAEPTARLNIMDIMRMCDCTSNVINDLRAHRSRVGRVPRLSTDIVAVRLARRPPGWPGSNKALLAILRNILNTLRRISNMLHCSIKSTFIASDRTAHRTAVSR